MIWLQPTQFELTHLIPHNSKYPSPTLSLNLLKKQNNQTNNNNIKFENH